MRGGGRVLLALLAATGGGVAGCGVPYSSDFSPIGSDQIPFELDQQTTTSTTTTISPTTTVVESSTSTTVVERTTTTVSVELVSIVYVAGSQLTPVLVSLAVNPSLPQVLAALIDGPPSGEIFKGLRAVIPEDAEPDVSYEAGVAIVDLPADIFDAMTPPEKRLAVGQIVLTLTRRPGVGQVRFLIDGTSRSVGVDGNGSSTAAGQLLSYEDYEALLGGAPVPTTTTSTSTTTTTPAPTTPAPTVPPETTPAP